MRSIVVDVANMINSACSMPKGSYSALEVADDLVLSRLISTMLSVTTGDHQSPSDPKSG